MKRRIKAMGKTKMTIEEAFNEIIYEKREEVSAVKYIEYAQFKKIVENQDKTLWQHKAGYKMLLAALNDYFEQ